MSSERVIAIGELWQRVWARRRGVALLVLAATVVTTVIAFVLPPWYQAQASLLPPSEEETGIGIASLFRGIGVPGIKIPTTATPAEVFQAILESRRVNEEVVRRFDLLHRYKRHFVEDAIKDLRDHAKFKLEQNGTITLRVEDRNPKTAADMANAYIELLDRFNRDIRMTKGRRTRIFVEGRLAETRRSLAVSEQRLADYQSSHKTVALTPEASSAVETGARLFAQRAALQVRLGVVQSYTVGQSDEEQQIRQQLAQLDRQLGTLPETGLELARLLRDVKTQEQLDLLLTAQYEEARINEVRDVATVEVLDPAVPPERKSRPHRGVMMLTAFLLSAAVGVTYASLQDEGAARAEARAAWAG